jgi:hypothetical protein
MKLCKNTKEKSMVKKTRVAGYWGLNGLEEKKFWILLDKNLVLCCFNVNND